MLLPHNSSLYPLQLLSYIISGFPTMLSAYPPSQTADGFFKNHSPVFETGFPSFENFDPFSSLAFEPDFLSFEDFTNLNQGPVLCEPVKPQNAKSSLDYIEPDFVLNEPVLSPSGSDNSNPSRKRAKNSSSSSDDVGPDPDGILVVDERKRRRMISNRESARRSRMRKQKHLENQRSQVNRLRLENRELVNRFRLVTHHLQVVCTDNERLQSEMVMLRHRLWNAQQVLMVRALQNHMPPANIMTPINQHILL